ncbi:hypothetical protein N7456_007124 [Penicillium angulare]|uniref:Bacteriophage T5 Orf172 DNA-binding domain-containing protein n=1 Tax=Penicillium angulare TaxID=116970 RepID=A0A9W9KDJ8_9EURO|nr:hypothetical protein N7456_007124 [Penicillium angulare]
MILSDNTYRTVGLACEKSIFEPGTKEALLPSLKKGKGDQLSYILCARSGSLSGKKNSGGTIEYKSTKQLKAGEEIKFRDAERSDVLHQVDTFQIVGSERTAHLKTATPAKIPISRKLKFQMSIADLDSRSSRLSKRMRAINTNTTLLQLKLSEVSDHTDVGFLSSLYGSKGTKRAKRVVFEHLSIKLIENICIDFASTTPETFCPRLRENIVTLSCNRSKMGPSGMGSVKMLKSLLKNVSPLQWDGSTELARQSFRRIIPLEIPARLFDDNSKCPAWKIGDRRCGNRRSVGSILHIIAELESVDMIDILHQIKRLVEMTMCGAHQRVALKELQARKPEFDKFDKLELDQLIQQSSESQLLAFISWICSLSDQAGLWRDQEILSSTSPRLNSRSADINPIQGFKPFGFRPLSGTLADNIKNLLHTNLKPRECDKKGFIYIFWHQGNFGFLKIGLSGHVDRRFKEWAKQCKKKVGEYYPKRENTEISKEIPHIYRVEALVHLELIQHRRIETKCHGCAKSHNEWFEVSLDSAIDVVRKWSTWMQTEPYERRIVAGKEQFVLKSPDCSLVNSLCQPLQQRLRSHTHNDKPSSVRSRASLSGSIGSEAGGELRLPNTRGRRVSNAS